MAFGNMFRRKKSWTLEAVRNAATNSFKGSDSSRNLSTTNSKSVPTRTSSSSKSNKVMDSPKNTSTNNSTKMLDTTDNSLEASVKDTRDVNNSESDSTNKSETVPDSEGENVNATTEQQCDESADAAEVNKNIKFVINSSVKTRTKVTLLLKW